VTRFNEAIDQAIAESVTQYSDDIGLTKDRFLAILGHDLRNPLGAITMSASFMLEQGELGEPYVKLLTRIASSARRMNGMVGDLLDFTRSKLGSDGIPITRAEMDLTKTVREVVSEVCARYPQRIIRVEANAEVRGEWDYARLAQALTNLVSNAVQHGAKDSPITVKLDETADEVTISVYNQGPVIPEEEVDQLFKAGAKAATDRASGDEHLGLGLFIVDRIVAAHRGKIDVHSTKEEGTTFTIHLPRAA
jgi:signal transduction histidine kinase